MCANFALENRAMKDLIEKARTTRKARCGLVYDRDLYAINCPKLPLCGSKSAVVFREPIDWLKRDQSVINAINELLEEYPGSGIWKYANTLKLRGAPWNHKRIYRVYCSQGLNLPRKEKKRVPERDPCNCLWAGRKCPSRFDKQGFRTKSDLQFLGGTCSSKDRLSYKILRYRDSGCTNPVL